MICRMSWSCLRSSPCLKITGYMAPSSALKISLAGIRALWHTHKEGLVNKVSHRYSFYSRQDEKVNYIIKVTLSVPWRVWRSRGRCLWSWSEAPEEEESAQSLRDSPSRCRPAEPAAAPSADTQGGLLLTQLSTDQCVHVLLQLKGINEKQCAYVKVCVNVNYFVNKSIQMFLLCNIIPKYDKIWYCHGYFHMNKQCQKT